MAQLLLSFVTFIGEWNSEVRMERDADGWVVGYCWAPYKLLLGTLEMVADALYDTKAALETMEYMGYRGTFVRRILWDLEVCATSIRCVPVAAVVVASLVLQVIHVVNEKGGWGSG